MKVEERKLTDLSNVASVKSANPSNTLNVALMKFTSSPKVASLKLANPSK